MNLPDDTHLAYIVSHEAWYAKTSRTVDGPSISVAASAEGNGGGVAWEFAVEEARFEVGGIHPISVRLFDDAFIAFAQIPEFFAALTEQGKSATLDSVRAALDSLGAVDETARQSPYAKEA